MLESAIYALMEEANRLRMKADQIDTIVAELHAMESDSSNIFSQNAWGSIGLNPVSSIQPTNVSPSEIASSPAQLPAPPAAATPVKKDLEEKNYEEICRSF
jgi:hypothetical protein